jgi:putative inorganic carbon (HCO3(-)) transporter
MAATPTQRNMSQPLRGARLLSGLAEASLYGILSLLPLSFWPYSFEMFGAPKALLLRGLTVLALVSWALASLLRGRLRLYPNPLYLPLAAFLAVNLLATLFSVAPRLSWLGQHYRNDGFLTLLCYAILFFLAGQLLRTRMQLRRATLWALATAVPISLLGLLQAYGLALPFLGSYGLGWRASSTQGNPDFLGAYLVLVWPLAAAYLLGAKTKGEHLLAAAALGILLAALAASLTRGAWIGFAGGAVVLLLLARKYLARQVVWIVAAVLGALLIAGLPQLPVRSTLPSPTLPTKSPLEAPAGKPTLGETLASMANPTAGSAQVRLWLWEASLPLIMENPLLGTGPNTFVSVVTRHLPKAYITGPETKFPDKAHNQFLDLAVGSGLLGLGAYIWLLWVFARRVSRWLKRRAHDPSYLLTAALLSAWVGYLVQGVFLFEVLDSGAIFWVFMALALSSVSRRARSLRLSLRMPAAGRMVIAGGLVLAGALALWLAWRPFAADLYLRQAEVAMGETHHPARAAVYYQKALEMDGGDGFILLRYALALSLEARFTTNPIRRQKAIQEADALLTRAIELNPRLSILFLRRGKVRELHGGRDLEALGDYRRAVELDPYYPDANIALANLLHRLDDPGEAILAEKRLLEVQPKDPDLLFNLGLDYAALGLWNQAQAAWQEGVRLAPQDAVLRYRLGTAYEAQGDMTRAREAYRQALSLDPLHQDAQEALRRLAGQP